MYKLIIPPSVDKQLKKLPKGIQERILLTLERSRIRPHHFFKRLKGLALYKLKVGKYRIIADIKDADLFVLVIEIGHRKNIYK
jgi:mRNA interferase RelE/StbE